MTPQRPPVPARRRPRNDARATKASGEAVEKAENGRVIPLSAPPASDGPAQGTDRPGDNSKADGHGPARGYSWPPFAKGDRAALVHGGYSERSVAERAEVVRGDLYAVAPWLAEQPSWAVAVERFLRTEARSRIFGEYVEQLAVERGAAAVPIRAVEVANAADRLAADLGSTLGLDPTSFAKLRALGASVSRDEAAAALGELRAEGALIVQRADRRLAAVPTAVPTERGTQT